MRAGGAERGARGAQRRLSDAPDGDDGLVLREQVERRVDRLDVHEARVDERLQLDLERPDVYIELDKVAVKVVVREGEQVVAAAHEPVREVLELLHERPHALELVARERAELLQRAKEVNELHDAPAEEVEAPEDGLLVEVELLRLGVHAQLLLGHAVDLLVQLVELQARREPLDENRRRVLPQVRALGVAVALLARRRVEDKLPAVGDHCVRHLDEEVRHARRRVEVARDRVLAEGAGTGWKGVSGGGRCARARARARSAAGRTIIFTLLMSAGSESMMSCGEPPAPSGSMNFSSVVRYLELSLRRGGRGGGGRRGLACAGG